MKLGTALCPSRTKALLLGSGELGKEVAIEFQRLGVEVIAVDRYPNAPAMQVAHRSHVINMLDAEALHRLVTEEKPDYIVPEIEAIATAELVKLEALGVNVVPTARAAQLTMDREGIRRLAAEELNLPTSPYQFVESHDEFLEAIKQIGFPFVIKPVMSSSGKGQSVVRDKAELDDAWQYAQAGGRAGAGRVIVEGFVPFDYEITQLTIRAIDGIHYCAPIGHRQEDGDYRESWQPQQMSTELLEKCQATARAIVENLGGYGLFGVELFIRGEEVYFNEISPRPHDTGMVTLISQDLSEFALHVRAILGLPIGEIKQHGPSASSVILGYGQSQDITFEGLSAALKLPDVQVRLFGKPEIEGRRRLGVTLARAKTIDNALENVKQVSESIKISY